MGNSEYWIFHEDQVKKALFFGETTFVYAAPAILHLLGFFTAVYVFRIADNEQLQNLVERVHVFFWLLNSETNSSLLYYIQ